mmetsp:Transcript_35643/g.59499  ORF Transcript_35643/g.59499 Transcript_35643/m.59499 type:complete len:306 (-) Transcript_35643:168-1085(-)
MSFADLKPSLATAPKPPQSSVAVAANNLRGNAAGFKPTGAIASRPAQAAQASDDTDYHRQNELITASIYQLSSNINAIERLLSQFGTPKDAQGVRERIHSLVEDSRGVVRDTDSALKKLSTETRAMEPQRAIQRRKLSKDFQQASKRFGEISKSYQDRLRKYPHPPRALISGSSTTENIQQSQDESRESLVAAHQREEKAYMEKQLSYNQAVIEERAVAIQDVETKVREVNEIMRDLAVIVVDQGHMIDNIESNIATAQETTSGATEELIRSDLHQRKSGRWLVGCLVLVCIMAFLLVLVLLRDL